MRSRKRCRTSQLFSEMVWLWVRLAMVDDCGRVDITKFVASSGS